MVADRVAAVKLCGDGQWRLASQRGHVSRSRGSLAQNVAVSDWTLLIPYRMPATGTPVFCGKSSKSVSVFERCYSQPAPGRPAPSFLWSLTGERGWRRAKQTVGDRTY